jgi:hypothetical protein
MLKGVIDMRDSEFSADYQSIKNEKFLVGDSHPGKRPRQQNIPSLSRDVAKTLAMFRFCAGKELGGTWNLTFPKRDGKQDPVRVFPSSKNEHTFWDCLALQVSVLVHTIFIKKI